MINITRGRMINMLRHYEDERESIWQMLEKMDEYCEIAPPAANTSGDRVQMQYNQTEQIERMLRDCSVSRAIKRRTLQRLLQDSRALDRLMECLSEIPGAQRNVITATVLNTETVETYAERKDVSVRTVDARKEKGLDLLYHKLTGRKVEAAQYKSPSTDEGAFDGAEGAEV